MQGTISNATPWPIRVTIKNSFEQVQSRQTTTGWNVGVDLTMNGPGVHAGVERKVNEKKKRKEEPGSFIVQPNCSNKSQLLLDLDKNKELYFSVTVLHPQGDIPLVSNLEVRNEKMIRNCVWVKDGYPVMT